jgi:hypothetical protein
LHLHTSVYIVYTIFLLLPLKKIKRDTWCFC